MTYFILLPLGLLGVLAGDFLLQRSVAHFVDTSRLTRLGLLVVVVWASGGWFMEASYGLQMARIAGECQGEISQGLMDLETFVYEVTGGRP